MLQGAVFKVLLGFKDRNECGFVELCEQAGYPTDLGGYYLRQLVRGGYVDKRERGVYVVSLKGKQALARSYNQKLAVPRPRLMVLLIAVQGDMLIVNRRTAQPFINMIEWPARSVLHGELLSEAAQSAVRERMGTSEIPEFVGFYRRIDKYDSFIFDDKLFAVHKVTVRPGVSISMAEPKSGELIVLAEEELNKLPNRSPALLDILEFSRSGAGLREGTYALTPDHLNT